MDVEVDEELARLPHDVGRRPRLGLEEALHLGAVVRCRRSGRARRGGQGRGGGPPPPRRPEGEATSEQRHGSRARRTTPLLGRPPPPPPLRDGRDPTGRGGGREGRARDGTQRAAVLAGRAEIEIP